MKKRQFFLFLCILLTGIACNKQQSKLKEINNLEKSLLADMANMDKSKAAELVKKSQEYAIAYPDDTTCAKVLFRAADVSRSIGDFPNSMKMWNEIQHNYPQSKYAAESLFMQGFTFENDMQNTDNAKECYLKFLNLYPNHELVDDISIALKNIDVPLEELIKQFEAKNRKELDEQAQ
jgi:tetratricopeptide (TPR) repeat protein